MCAKFQVAMLKEERANLISENEDLYGKVGLSSLLFDSSFLKVESAVLL